MQNKNIFVKIFLIKGANTVCKSLATSDGALAQKIVPSQNLVILEDGREINYDTLMIATGLGQDMDQIKGLESALQDIDCPVFTTFDFNPDTVSFIFDSAFYNYY